ncbi:MAG: hypothetical protein WDZ94_01010 [Patescibacteria group bacterium]
MDLTNLFTAQTEPPEQMVICIILTDTSVQALLLAISVSNAQVVSQSSVLTYTDAKNCVLKTDEALQDLGSNSEQVNEVLFAVEDSWLEAGDVDASHQNLLKEVSENLSLKPIGFVVQSEALFQQYLNIHTHFSAVMVLFSSAHITVQVVRQGRLQYSTVVGRSKDSASDVQEALARYVAAQEGEALPAKIVCSSFVLAMTELKQLQQALLDFQWGDAVSFVQAPTIDVIDVKQAVQAVAYQAGQALLAQISPEMQAAAVDNSTVPQSSEADEATTQSAVSDEASSDQVAPTSKSTSRATASSFGVPISDAALADSGDSETAVESEFATTKKSELGLGSKRVTGVKKPSTKLFVGIGIAAGIVALISVVFVYASFLSQLTAVISPKQITVSKDISITLDPSAEEADSSTNTIPAETVTLELTTTEEIETTGIKIVGDQAKGTVILYNKTEGDKQFPEGTVLSVDELQFLLDEEVVVPASEVEERASGRSITFGEQQVAVTAYQIGVEGNIGEETELTVENFDDSTYSAVSNTAFTGGSSREVRVVAEEDIAAVLEKARQSLLAQANQQFEEDSTAGRYVITTETISALNTQYSHELEVEADILTVTATGEITTLAYNSSDLRPIATAALSSELPEGYTIHDQEPQIMSAPADNLTEETETIIESQVTSQAVPRYDEAQLKTDIVGKSLEEARELLQRRESIEKVVFVHHPTWVRPFVRSVPNSVTRISVQQAEE